MVVYDNMRGIAPHSRLEWLPWFFAALVPCLFLAGCSGVGGTAEQAYGFLEASRPEATTELSLQMQGQPVAVELFFPDGYTKSQLFPVCLAPRAAQTPLLPDMRRAAARKGFILALIRLPSPSSEQALLPLVDELLDRLRREYAADPRRITLYGREDDANLAARLACARSHRVAGLALVDGGTTPESCRPVKAIPTIVFSAGQDALLEVAGFWARNNGCAPQPQPLLKNGLLRERYQCPAPRSAVQRYAVENPPPDEDPFAGFPAAWSMFEFLARQSAQD